MTPTDETINFLRLRINRKKFKEKLDKLGRLMGHTTHAQTVEFLLDKYIETDIKLQEDVRGDKND